MSAGDVAVALEGVAARHDDRPVGEVHSEWGRLRTALVHRPGAELGAVDAANAEAMLFAGAVDVEPAQNEHDALAAALRAHGVEIMYVERLLAEIAGDDRRREALLARALADMPAAVRRRVALLPPPRLARALIGGLTQGPIGPVTGRPTRARPLHAVPNLLFVRDSSVWIGGTVMVGAMATHVRRRESALVAAIYELHPRFAAAATWSPSGGGPIRVEGGDVLLATPGRLMVGISPRTSASGAHRMAATLLRQGAVTDILTVEIPRGAGIHLDLVVTIVDRETFAVWAPVRRALRAHRWRATSSGVAVRAVPDPFAWLSPSSRVIELGSDGPELHGRPWDHGVNVLPLAAGLVLAYEDNSKANEQLTAAGVQVIAVPGAMLGRGRGGPRCLTCPLARDRHTG